LSRRFLTPVNLTTGNSLPVSGIAGDLFYKLDEQKIYVHDGTTWIVAQGSGGQTTVSDTPPEDPTVGDTWFDSTTAKSYVYYDDAWVDVSVGSIGPTGPTGATGSQGEIGPTGPAGESIGSISLLTDVSISSLLGGDILLYNSGTSLWENTPLGGILFSEESAAWHRNNLLEVLLETGLVTTEGGSYNTTTFTGIMDGGFFNTTSFPLIYDGGSAGSI
jgi:hypothetical protein